MPLGMQIAQELPYLRRYARALCGSQPAGDRLVHATLAQAVAEPTIRTALEFGGRVALYRAFTRLWTSGPALPVAPSPEGPEGAAQSHLARITPRDRQALLLTTLEDFSPEDAAAIMDTTREEVLSLVAEANAEIARHTATRVLIIEDEPLIAMQLEELVQGLGHALCGTAATRTQARLIVASDQPGLVLADIQLADGSSGLDAVSDILALSDVPVIFITAFPERLLTGDRPEPTYLITKPFHEDTVRAAIAQALFLRHPVALAD